MILVLTAISVLAGSLGALLGIGGGMIIVPFLTLVMGVNIRYAIAASLVSIVATSSGAAVAYLRDRLTNLRVAVFLEIGTVTGAIAGFYLASHVSVPAIYIVFGSFLVFSALMMLRKRDSDFALSNHPWADRLRLNSQFKNETGVEVSYFVANPPIALVLMFLAGVLSALLGIGSGVLKVLAMDGAMKLPMKVSSATSNFMIGVTATASAGAYFLRGDIRPEIAGPVSLGILLGSFIGSKLMTQIKSQVLRRIFVVLLLIVAFQMLYKGWLSL